MSQFKYAGVLPFRLRYATPELLLITSRRADDWLIPKGRLSGKESGYEAAQREAYEEAGIEGILEQRAIGVYEHKTRKRGQLKRTLIFPMQVTFRHGVWPECNQRQSRWVRPELAERLVQANLQLIIRQFSRRWRHRQHEAISTGPLHRPSLWNL